MLMLLPHPELSQASRLRRLSGEHTQITFLEWAILLAAGVFAAVVSTVVDLHLRVPGHAILKAVLPLSIGLALVPRKGAGSVMSAVALMTAFGLRQRGFGGAGLGFGALTSLAMLGPILDLTLRKVRTGMGIYLAMALAGFSANFLAFAVRGTMKWTGMEHVGKPFSVWASTAVVTYTLCGFAAGLICGCLLFGTTLRGQHDSEDSTGSVS